jgi:A/G-specific adenine glycosylase
VLLRRRPRHGLLGGMAELPGTPWRERPWSAAEALEHAPMRAEWRDLGLIRHVFTHFELSLGVFRAQVPAIQAEGWLSETAALEQEALPSVMRKCVRLALAVGDDKPVVK